MAYLQGPGVWAEVSITVCRVVTEPTATPQHPPSSDNADGAEVEKARPRGNLLVLEGEHSLLCG